MQLNNLEKKMISKSDIFNKISSLDIYKSYCPNFQLGTRIHSPFRKDADPSFGFFVGGSNEVLFKDFATLEKGDCIDFVQKMYSLSFFDALSKIATDFNFSTEENFFYKDFSHQKTSVSTYSKDEHYSMMEALKVKPEIRVRMRDWNNNDAEFWAKRGISARVLKFYRVVPISHLFINDRIITADKLAYAFIETKDGEETYKIYQPFNKEGLKWFSSHNSSIWQGWTQLPEFGPELIITKSLKDVMSIVNLLRIPAIAMQSENTLPKESVIKELKTRFDEIYILYDNDFDKEINVGRERGKELAASIQGSVQIEMLDNWKVKDFSDLVYDRVEKADTLVNGYKEAVTLFKSNLLLPF